MIRLGIVDFDTSHVVSFTKRLNHLDIGEDQRVDGAQVVAGWPGTSRHSPDHLPKYTQQLRDFGITIVDDRQQLIDLCDAILIEANDGTVHLERAMPFLQAGMPCFIDKPFACSMADACAMMELADKHGTPIFSSSAQRFNPQVVAAAASDEVGRIIGAATCSPAKEHSVNPGLFNYGIHGVEMLYALMGPGCKKISCAYTESTEVTTGIWEDGRVGTIRGVREGAQGYHFTVWGENSVRAEAMDSTYSQRELLRKIVKFFETGKSPVAPMETLEVIAFIEVSLRSRHQNGAWLELPR